MSDKKVCYLDYRYRILDEQNLGMDLWINFIKEEERKSIFLEICDIILQNLRKNEVPSFCDIENLYNCLISYSETNPFDKWYYFDWNVIICDIGTNITSKKEQLALMLNITKAIKIALMRNDYISAHTASVKLKAVSMLDLP